jgi:hypothetical protein
VKVAHEIHREAGSYLESSGLAAFAGLKFTMGGPEGFGGGWAK